MSPDEDKYGFIFNGNKYCTLYTSLIEYGDEEPLFFDKDINSIDVIKLPKNCTSTFQMFLGADKLKSINLENVNTENITNTTGMFLGTTALTTITGFEKLNFTKVIDTSYMFAGTSLTSIDLSGFKESNVKIADGMFFGTNELTDLTITNLKYIGKESLQSAELMFSYSKMTSAIATDISKMETSNLVNVTYMFSGIDDNTIDIDLSAWKANKIKNAEGMFMGSKLKSLKLADSTSLENAESMFEDACLLEGIDGTDELIFKNLNNVKSMFKGYGVCTGETIDTMTLDLSELDTKNIKSAEKMFSEAKLTGLTLANFQKLENATTMFKDAEIKGFTITNLEFSSLKYADSMFENLKGLDEIDLSGLEFPMLSSVNKMFFGSDIETYKLKGFKNITNMGEMFAESKASEINLENWENNDKPINTTDAFKVAATPEGEPKRTVTVSFEFSDNTKIKDELRSNRFTCEEVAKETDTCKKDNV
jgi:surface protein